MSVLIVAEINLLVPAVPVDVGTRLTVFDAFRNVMRRADAR
mgnify:CR=1 FL=1